MMVPRSFAFQRTPSKEEIRVDEKSIGIRARFEPPRPRSAPTVITHKKIERGETTIRSDKDEERSRPTTAIRTVTEPVSVPSQPVVIPPRSEPFEPTSSGRRRSRQERSRTGRPRDNRHNPRAPPPSVAALLSVTSIPPPNPNASQRRRTSGLQSFHKTSIDDLIQEWREEDLPASSNSFTPGSPLDLLLERPDESEAEDLTGTSPSLAEESLLDNRESISSRSVSSDSIMSIPDLVHEDRSPPSWSGPNTPSIRSRPAATSVQKSGKDRVVSSPPTQDCLADHPLLSPLPQDEPILLESPDFRASLSSSQRSKSLPRPSPKSSFKSNLTASINALASSFRSFSNFTAPSIPPDDLLTRSLFSPSLTSPQRFVSEMRPKSSDGVPDPALRRYLNPTPERERERQHNQRRLSLEDQHVSALTLYPEPDFAAAVNASSSLKAALEHEGPMIQMQTYGPATRGKKGRRAASRSLSRDPNSEAGRIAQAADGSALRQREPRENSDFLRVIVLEMNMRREGKLDARGQGKARIWLPPRKMSAVGKEKDDAAEEAGSRKVPARWIGVGVNDV